LRHRNIRPRGGSTRHSKSANTPRPERLVPDPGMFMLGE